MQVLGRRSRQASRPLPLVGCRRNKNQPRAHIRQTHWRPLLEGKERADRKLKWLHPTWVNTARDKDMPVGQLGGHTSADAS